MHVAVGDRPGEDKALYRYLQVSAAVRQRRIELWRGRSSGFGQDDAPPLGDDPLRLDRQVCFPLYAATNLIGRLYRPVLAKLGLTYAVPGDVGALGGRAADRRFVGRRLYLDSGTLTPLLKRMEAAGLVVRRRDVRDERRVQIDLTDKGRRLRPRAADDGGRLRS